ASAPAGTDTLTRCTGGAGATIHVATPPHPPPRGDRSRADGVAAPARKAPRTAGEGLRAGPATPSPRSRAARAPRHRTPTTATPTRLMVHSTPPHSWRGGPLPTPEPCSATITHMPDAADRSGVSGAGAASPSFASTYSAAFRAAPTHWSML